MTRYAFAIALLAAAAAATVRADTIRYADRVVNFHQGPDAVLFFDDSATAVGQPSLEHTATVPANADADGNPTLVSLGQGGTLVLGFDQPVPDQGPSPANPYGYDLLVWGNCMQGGGTISGRFAEPGFIEVAQADAAGDPIEWFLILPRLFTGGTASDLPPGLLTAAHAYNTTALLDGLADTVPANGAALAGYLASGDLADLVLDDPATFAVEGVGGAGVDIARAVRQSAPGVPLLDGLANPQFIALPSIDLLRITDAGDDDLLPNFLGAVSTEVDGVIVLPSMASQAPEPATLAFLAAGAAGLMARRRRRR